MKNLLKVMAAVVALAFLAVSCGVVSFTGRKQILLFSDSEISALSDQSYADFMKTAQVSSNAQATRMLKGVGEKMVAALESYMKKQGQSGALSGL